MITSYFTVYHCAVPRLFALLRLWGTAGVATRPARGCSPLGSGGGIFTWRLANAADRFPCPSTRLIAGRPSCPDLGPEPQPPRPSHTLTGWTTCP